MRYAYERCSTDKQDLLRQEFALQGLSIDKIFSEHITGKMKCTERPEFEKMLAELKQGDEIYFESMSRMARSMFDLIDTTNYLVKEKQCTVHFLKENIVVGVKGMDAMTSLMFNIMGAFAQFERDLIADRTKQALQAKKSQGVKLGRAYTYDEEVVMRVKEMREQGYCFSKISEILGMAKSTAAELAKRG